MRRDVFQAIADPTRRNIIDLLSQKQMNLNAIAEQFEISRPAISKHIRILTECGLVEVKQDGRERYCSVQLQSLGEVSKWIKPYKVFWNDKMDAPEAHLSSKKKTKKKNKNKK